MVEKASTLLMFGATGDLARRMLLPSLYGLDSDGLLPADLRIIGTARTELDDDTFRERADEALKEHLPSGFYSEGIAERFLSRLHYVPLDINDSQGFSRLAETIGDPCHGVAIFLSTAPSLFKPTIDGLQAAGLACPTVRMALEKPLGVDLESSREINDAVAAAFPEDRTFRIDHYLGKETVQNLLALRFANSMFEPLWNSAHIEHVQITVAETIGLEGRGDYYDQAGRASRHGPEPHAPAPGAGRDGAADGLRCDGGSGRESEGASSASPDHRRRCRSDDRRQVSTRAGRSMASRSRAISKRWAARAPRKPSSP